MNKTVLALAIFAFCLLPQAHSSNMRGTNDRELGAISLGNIGTIIGELLNGFGNNSTNPLPVQIVHFNNTSSSNTTVPSNNTSSANTTAPVNNSASTNATAPADNTTAANTTAPVTNNSTSSTPVSNSTSPTGSSPAPVDNSTASTNTTTPVAPVSNTTQPATTNNTSSSTNSTTNTTTSTNTTTTPAAPAPAPVWYARNDVYMPGFASKCLVIHNILRSAVGVAPLTWSDSLAASAQAWAENMAVNGFRHSGRTGENIASTTASSKVLDMLLDLWTREQDWFIKGCRYPSCSSTGAEVGHYTQMVWSTTTQVGCGFAPGVDKQWNYLCCQYYRAGNIIGYYVYPYTNPTTGVTTP